jgi:hypothetical protein
VAQTSLGINLKSWKITMPKYVRGWYRELSKEEYFAEFKEGPAILGRRLQSVVSGLVSSLIHRGMARAAERFVKAREKVKKISDDRQKAFQLLAAIVDRRKKEFFDPLVEPIRQRHREREAMRREDLNATRIAREEAREQRAKAARELKARMDCPLYKKRLAEEKVAKEKEEQKHMLAYDAERQKEKMEQRKIDAANRVEREEHLKRKREEEKEQQKIAVANYEERQKEKMEQQNINAANHAEREEHLKRKREEQ